MTKVDNFKYSTQIQKKLLTKLNDIKYSELLYSNRFSLTLLKLPNAVFFFFQHMIKYRYLPFSHGKTKYKGKEETGKVAAS